MPIAIPEIAGQRFLLAIADFAKKARLVRDQSGDLTYALINDMQTAMAEIEASLPDLQAAAQAQPLITRNYIADRGGPATLTAVQQGVTALQTAITPWQTRVRDTAQALTGTDLIEVKANNYRGVTLRRIAAKDAIPGSSATLLRASPELAEVITALEALGG